MLSSSEMRSLTDCRYLILNGSLPGQPEETGYGYQLVEQTEILLRLSLLAILENVTLFSTFSDPKLLDAYF